MASRPSCSERVPRYTVAELVEQERVAKTYLKIALEGAAQQEQRRPMLQKRLADAEAALRQAPGDPEARELVDGACGWRAQLASLEMWLASYVRQIELYTSNLEVIGNALRAARAVESRGE